MYKLLALLALLRGIELVFLVVVLCPVLSMPVAKLYMSLYVLSFTITSLASIATYLMYEKGEPILLIASVSLVVLDLYTLAYMLYGGKLMLLIVYVSSVINMLIDLVLLLLAIELARR